jgi:hypothetical protein
VHEVDVELVTSAAGAGETGLVAVCKTALYSCGMVDKTRRVKIGSLYEQGKETDLENTTPAERLSMMWQLALDAWTFKGEALAQSRLPRHIVSVRRGNYPLEGSTRCQ